MKEVSKLGEECPHSHRLQAGGKTNLDDPVKLEMIHASISLCLSIVC